MKLIIDIPEETWREVNRCGLFLCPRDKEYLVNSITHGTSIPVNPQPKTGHWIEIAQYSDGNHKIECSECKSHIFDRGHANSFNVKNRYKYCPNCGCRMVEPKESEGKE